MLQSEDSIVKAVVQKALHTAYTPIGRNIAYIKSCVSPCSINCTHVNACKLLWKQTNYTDIDVINNGNSIIELCNISEGFNLVFFYFFVIRPHIALCTLCTNKKLERTWYMVLSFIILIFFTFIV